MKFLHLSDLHLGIRVNEFSLLEDQKHILSAILAVAADERPDAVLIAGDVYDKSAPSAEAVELFDRFLTQLAERGYQVLIIDDGSDSDYDEVFAEAERFGVVLRHDKNRGIGRAIRI